MRTLVDRLNKINKLNCVFYVSVFFTLAYLFLRILLVFSNSSDLGGVENSVVYSISKALYGIPLYGDPESGNFDITQYSPVLYMVNLFIDRLFGLTPLTDVQSIYFVARGINLVVNVFSAFLIYKLLVKQFAVHNKIAILSCCLFLISLTRFHFSGRPDAFFNLNFILLIYFFIKYQVASDRKTRIKMAILTTLFVAFSFFIKQSGIQFFVLIPVFFVLRLEIKKAIYFAFLTFIFFALFMLLFNFIYGPFFMKNIIGGIVNEIKITNAIELFFNFYSKSSFLFVIGMVASIFYFKNKSSDVEKFISFCAFFIFSFSFLLTSKIGAGINYYNEFLVISVIFGAMEIKKISQVSSQLNDQEIVKVTTTFFAVFISLLFPIIICQKYFHEDSVHLSENGLRWKEKMKFSRVLKNKLDKFPNSFLLSFDSDINSILANKAVAPNKGMIPDQTIFNYSLFDRKIQDGTIKFIVCENSLLSNSFLNNDFTKFKLYYKDTDFTILENNKQFHQNKNIE
jgi:hypothetical protein